ncbi:rod shape-determining protein [Nodularia spumigena CS-584]|jgi:rod shape-determining protein MreB and related proteins|uniref:Cell shape-determining protein MreB n=1 Tax=Nodularia spumigena UHCC 0060 TaxID=3110300 RepID=A0ABU5UMS3_NODSP|nr:rod shape-determining protein [Nodularia spumigena]AHJ30287.1 Rod shape-determining protein MreB [Nodularia spumigena CCY9414]EAW46637.1 rod shape-determining protein [Nodularia spumigena CCY9414]MDB9384700.1 rod shape-determining protein [Nodularia spumigena CS-584]MEA5558283.1 rod shape-determining protein [Nodularia spumigena CH309]MEA5607538.1 rod shape-determining protein [Nodularia spumigena UHCC 0060]
MGIDLGTANTLVYVSGKGIVLQEPSVVAIDQNRKIAVAVGEEAKKMLGRTPRNVIALRPLRDGVISDSDIAELMLKEFILRVNGGKSLISPRIVIGIPSGVTGVERRAISNAAVEAGAREVYLIDEPMAAAIGAGLPVSEATGNMIVDIGGGTTEVAVLSFQGTVISESVRVAGDELNESIIMYLKKAYNLVIGEWTAEDIKIRIGSAYPTEHDNEAMMEVRGVHLLSGLPRTVTLKGAEIRECMLEPLSVIIAAVKRTLERTPPELASDIIDRGIMIAGGGALLRGIETLISHETGLLTHIAADPLCCVVQGTGRVLENFEQLERVLSGRYGNN